ncbi:MAG: TlyA family RNA methyltransferase [Bacteriovoracaceae bacterium]|nr:TlyA family RNA methyltransferase [Bacteriovoracaceae bacterium]
MKDRADKILVKFGHISTRSKARLLINDGVVYSKGIKITKAGQMIDEIDLEVRKDVVYVGRGGDKLKKAINDFGISIKGMIVADIGASTGGFTQVVLKNGAKKVYCVDVGKDQLDKILKDDILIINLEGINIKNPVKLPEKVDFCVVDLSFISLKLALKNIFSLLIEKGEVVALVKPQFEVGKSGVGKGGIVKNKQTRIDAIVQLFDWCTENGFFVKNAIRSPIEGKNGNVEFFFHLTTSNECLFQREELEKL